MVKIRECAFSPISPNNVLAQFLALTSSKVSPVEDKWRQLMMTEVTQLCSLVGDLDGDSSFWLQPQLLLLLQNNATDGRVPSSSLAVSLSLSVCVCPAQVNYLVNVLNNGQTITSDFIFYGRVPALTLQPWSVLSRCPF